HPHLHCIVTGGALSPDGKQWRSRKQLEARRPKAERKKKWNLPSLRYMRSECYRLLPVEGAHLRQSRAVDVPEDPKRRLTHRSSIPRFGFQFADRLLMDR